MSTIKAIGGTLTQFGKKLALGITASSANVKGPQVEVNVPPEWEGTDISTDFRFSSSSGKYLDAPSNNNYVYHAGDTSNFSSNGLVYSYDKDFGTNFALNQRAFVSASDRNTNDSITLTLMSESIVSGTVDIREITMSDINVNFPDNGNSTSINTASLFLTTSSNFQIFQDHDYRFVVRATDEQGDRSRLNIDGNSLNNIGYDLEYRAVVYPFGEKPFIITQSNDVGISASTSPNDHIGEMSFAVGNESSPDFTQIKDIFIKHRQFIGSNSSTEISTIKTFGDAVLSNPSLLPGVQASNAAHFNTTTGSLPNRFVVSSSNLPPSADLNLSSSNRHFQINFKPGLLPQKLSAKNSPYIFDITASTGTYTPVGVGTSPVQTCSSSIQIVVTNENPVFSIVRPESSSATASLQNIDFDTKKSTIIKTYPSASDPGEDNITLSLISLAVDSGNGSTGTKGLSSNHFAVEFVNNNTPTASFFIVTSSDFPTSFADGVITGNEKVLATVRASDECSPAGTSDGLGALFIDAPPSWSAVAQTIATNENSVGSILSSNTYKTVFDDITHIGTTNSGDITLDTGSGFIVTCADPRLSGSHFTFSGSTAINGNNVSFAVGTSSLFDRIDANAAVKIIVTASDNRSQTAHHTFQVNVINVDEFIDVLGSDLLGDLRTFFSVRVDGATAGLGNTIADISSLIDTPTGSISIVSGSQTSAHITQSAQYSQTTITSANGNTVDFDVISTGVAAPRIPSYSVNTLKGSGAGSFVLWSKTGARSSLSVENDTIFGQALGGLNENTFNFSSEAAGSPNAKLNIGNTSIDVLRYFNTVAEGSTFSGRDFHQLAVTWEGTGIGDEFKLYYNSTLVGSASSNANVGNAIGRGAYLGALGSDTETPSQIQPISMSIFASFNKQLTTSEVTTIFNAFSGSHGL